MKLDFFNVLAIVAMAVATYATRISGLLLLKMTDPPRAVRSALDAVPVAVLTAVIAPTLVKGGPADLLAAGITVLAALRLPLLPTVVIGVGAAVVLRATIGT
ncbi:MAG: AzlD family protein [Hyphomicrobiaceae bacterium]